MNKRIRQFLKESKKKLQRRLRRKQYSDQPKPMFKAANIAYTISEKVEAIGYGGIGMMHTLVRRLKLDRAINEALRLLKVHVPYWESDHVLNMAYNILCGGSCLEDIEGLRQDTAYTQGLGAERIPDPTTAGDFLRRFDEPSILALQEVYNDTRRKVWRQQEADFRREAIIDTDGTIAPTTGECKQGMHLSYKGVWGYAPLIISLANTQEVLYLVNRPGNSPSSQGAAEWIDRAIGVVGREFETLWLRGDTDFSMTQHLDGWDAKGVRFVLGYDARENLIRQAERLAPSAWQGFQRPPRYEVQTEPRQRPDNVKEQIVQEREYQNIRLDSEQVAEFEYRPTWCEKTYRMVVLRKNLSIERGERRLFEEVRYFFYITNDGDKTAAEVILFANDRCNQENVIAQLKNGVNALRMPSQDLLSNWAYMVIAALAWNLKAWYGLVMPAWAPGWQVLRMEFKRFVRSFIQIPCQILKAGRKLEYRLLAYTEHVQAILATFTRIRKLVFT